MSGEFELAWKRSRVTGNYEATDSRQDPPVTYIAGRNPSAAPGRQWQLTAHVPGKIQQTRTGLDRLFTAQQGALSTRCRMCFRHLPFAALGRSGSNGGWQCRNRADCAKTVAEREAGREQIRREIRDTDLEEIGVTDTADGPKLVFVTAGTGNRITVECTETDLARLFRVLARRMRDLAMADIQDMIRQCDELLAAHGEQEASP